MEIVFVASENDAGRALKRVLREHLRLSASMLRRLKVQGEILLNGQPVFVNVQLSAGDCICLRFPAETADFPAEEGKVDVLWEDEHFFAVNKPAGLITHPTHSRYSGTLANFALFYSQTHGGAGCHAVNRLDRDTSGIVLFAKNAYAKSLVTELKCEKLYLAVVCGGTKDDEGTVCLPIKRENPNDMRRITAPDGKPSVTHYKVLRRCNGYSLLRLRLETGRTHQIRVHMAAIGCPLLGDELYASHTSSELSQKLSVPHQLLHAESLRFFHPLSGERIHLSCQADWPENILQTLL